MKWDFLVGNPPYQAETVEHVSETNGQAPRKNVFHYFQMEADKISEKSKSMTPHCQRLSSILMPMKCLAKRQTFPTGLRLY